MKSGGQPPLPDLFFSTGLGGMNSGGQPPLPDLFSSTGLGGMNSGGKPLFLTCSFLQGAWKRTSQEEGLAPAFHGILPKLCKQNIHGEPV